MAQTEEMTSETMDIINLNCSIARLQMRLSEYHMEEDA